MEDDHDYHAFNNNRQKQKKKKVLNPFVMLGNRRGSIL